MPHPFFDSLTYRWDRKDGRALHEALYLVVTDAGRITELFRGAGPGLRPLTHGAPDGMWREALDKLVTAKRLADLCSLILADKDLAAIHDQVRSVQDAIDPIKEAVLSDAEHIFIDRKRLRDKLQRISSSETCRVLLVRGGSQCGKTWTQLMVAEVARTMGEECIYLYEGNISTIRDVVDELFTTFGATAEEKAAVLDQTSTDDGWFLTVCRRLGALGAKKSQVSWLVIDDLGEDETGPRLDPMIRRFADQVVVSMANPAFAKWFRIVLLDYPDRGSRSRGVGVPTKWRDVWDEDRPDVAEVDAAALEDFILLWARRKNKNIGEDDAKKFAADVIAAVEEETGADDPPSRLKSIHDALQATLETL